MIQLTFEHEKDTKNTKRFKEVDAVVNGVEVEADFGHAVGTLYVQKWALRECFPDGLPPKLVVTIGAL